MNSHTKPRHENKQDLIYLLPVSRQMPGWAGGTVCEGEWDQLWLNLAWDSQEGTIPFTSPVYSLSRIPHPPAALCNVPQSHHQCWGAGDGDGGSGDNLDPGSAPQGTAESAWHQDIAPVPLAAGTSCQDRTTKAPPAAPDHSPFGLWKLQPGGFGPNPLTCPQHKPTASSSRRAARRPNLCRHHQVHRAGTGEGGPSLHPPQHLSIPHPPPPAESPVSNPRQVPSAGPGGRGAFLRAGPGAAAAGQSPSPRRGQLVLTLPVRCWEKEPGGE